MLKVKLGSFYRQNEIDKNAMLFIANRKSYSQVGRRWFDAGLPP